MLAQRRGLSDTAAQLEPQCAWLADVLTQLGLHEKVSSPEALQQRPRQQALLNFTLQGLPRLKEALQVCLAWLLLLCIVPIICLLPGCCLAQGQLCTQG